MNENTIPEVEEHEEERDAAEEYYIFIQKQILKWIAISGCASASFFLLILHDLFGVGLGVVVTPFVIRNSCLVGKACVQATQDYSLYNLALKKEDLRDIGGNLGDLLFELLLMLYLTIDPFNFSICLVPLLLGNLFRSLIRTPPHNECTALSNLVRSRQIIFTSQWLESFTFIMLALLLDGYIEVKWSAAIWPIWVMLIFIGLITLGSLLLAIGSFFSYLSAQTGLKDFVASVWLLYTTGGSFFSFGYFFLALTSSPGISLTAIAIYPLLFLVVFMGFSSSVLRLLVQWWYEFFIEQDDIQIVAPDIRVAPTLPMQIVNSVKRPPKLLIRLSSSYFQPASLRQNAPANRRTLSNRCENKDTKSPSQRRHHSFQVPLPRVSAISRPSNQCPSSLSVDSSTEKPCSICYDNGSNAVIMECGHGGICYDCSLFVWKTKGTCHMCRSPITQILQIDQRPAKLVKVLSTTRAVYPN